MRNESQKFKEIEESAKLTQNKEDLKQKKQQFEL